MELWNVGVLGFRCQRSNTPSRQFCNALSIQPVDVAGFVEFLEKTGVDEFRRVRRLRRWDAVADIFEYRFERFQIGVRLGLHGLAQGLIGIFELFGVLGLAVFHERALGFFGVGPNDVDRLDVGLHHTPDDVAVPGDVALCRD